MIYDINGNELQSNASSTTVSKNDMTLYEPLLALADRSQYSGYINSSGIWTYTASSSYIITPIPVTAGATLNYKGNATNQTRIYVLKSFNLEEGVEADFSDTLSTLYSTNTSGSCTIPDDATYIAIQMIMGGNDGSPQYFIIDNIDYVLGAREELRDEKFGNEIKWVAFGDSITSGYYSYFNDDGSASSVASGVAYNWSTLLADINHWDLTNKGYGGMGWLYASTSSDTYVAYNRVQEVDFTQYNLVTFAYGINDWKSGVTTFGDLTDEASDSPTTVVSSMKYCFDYVLNSNPACKIIVFLPLNCRGYSYNYGDESTSWARGYTINGLTLDEFSESMKEVCDLYGIEYIDLTRHSCVNNGNIATLLPDGVHPSIDCHFLLSKELAKKISFK